jgi:aldehyde:ferredoxin oxidoreductase
MKILAGYCSKMISVDLTEKRVSTKPIAGEVLHRFVGGSGMAARMLLEHIDPERSPLSPENRLYLATGPFTGTRIPSTGRHALVSRSPLTGIFAESDVGGYFGTVLKQIRYGGI